MNQVGLLGDLSTIAPEVDLAVLKSFPFIKETKFHELTTMNKRFVIAYAMKDLNNWVDADIYMFTTNNYELSRVNASQSTFFLKQKPAVKYFLDKIDWMRVEAMGFQAQRIIEEEAGIAYSDITEYLDPDGYLKMDLHTLPGVIRRAIKSIEVTEGKDGSTKRKITLWDKGQSLNRMQKMKGMHTENINIKQASININQEMDPVDAAKAYAQMMTEDND